MARAAWPRCMVLGARRPVTRAPPPDSPGIASLIAMATIQQPGVPRHWKSCVCMDFRPLPPWGSPHGGGGYQQRGPSALHPRCLAKSHGLYICMPEASFPCVKASNKRNGILEAWQDIRT